MRNFDYLKDENDHVKVDIDENQIEIVEVNVKDHEERIKKDIYEIAKIDLKEIKAI